MWRFMFATFAILFLAFYQLSGGADYKPRQNSLQAQAASDADVQVTALANKPVAEEQTTARAQAPSQVDQTSRVQVTLASVQVETPTLKTQTNKAERLTQPTVEVDEAAVTAALEQSEDSETKQVWPGAIELFAMQAEQAQTRAELRAEVEAAERASKDIRFVTGNVVNMRDGPGTDYAKITALRGGTEVAVLNEPGNGWLELEVLETGQIGWMADWLISGN